MAKIGFVTLKLNGSKKQRLLKRLLLEMLLLEFRQSSCHWIIKLGHISNLGSLILVILAVIYR